MRKCAFAASLMLLAGTTASFAQPVVLDGQLSGSDVASYGAAKWLQTQPTTFGDNRPDLCSAFAGGIDLAINNSNTAGVNGSQSGDQSAAAAAVTTGFEIRIPFAKLGLASNASSGTIKLAGYITNGDQGFMSNQIIGGMPEGQGNISGIGGYSDPRDINFNTLPGSPSSKIIDIAIPAVASSSTATIDGTVDAAYGAALWVQNLGTQFGNMTGGNAACNGGGSELDNLHAYVSVDGGGNRFLNIFVGGNLEQGGNRLNLFIDSIAGGQNRLLNGNPGNGGLGRISNNFATNGQTFTTGFDADRFLTLSLGGCPTIGGAFVELTTAGTGGQASDLPVVCPPNEAISLGSELNALYSYVDRGSGRLNILATGNFRADDFLVFFFDANGNPTGDEGQNQFNGTGSTPRRNVNLGLADGGAGSLNRLGSSDGTNGLKFDAGFFSDYYLNTHIENINRQVVDAAVTPTGGRREDINTAALDFGAFQGKNVPTEINFDGTNFCCVGGATDIQGLSGIGWQSGSEGNVYSGYAPREAHRVLQRYLALNGNNYAATAADWSTWITTGAPVADRPRAGLIRARLDNSNIAGVTDTSAAGAATASRGFEVSISLEELGYNPRSRIRVAGFLIRNGFTLVGNQTLGATTGAADLGEPRAVDFSTIAGNQFVVVSSCVADFDENGTVEVPDIFSFLAGWFGGNPRADLNGSASLDVPDIFAFLAIWFQGPCIGG